MMHRQGGFPGHDACTRSSRRLHPGIDLAPLGSNIDPRSIEHRPRIDPKATFETVSFLLQADHLTACRSSGPTFVAIFVNSNPCRSSFCKSCIISDVVAMIVNSDFNGCMLFVFVVVHRCEHRDRSVRPTSACTSHSGRFVR